MEATIAKIKKNANSEIWVCLSEFQSKQYVDVREYFLTADDRQWRPTKKGLMILPQFLTEVVAGIEALETQTDLGTVATVPKSTHDEIQIGYRQFGTSRYGEVRLWYWSNEDSERKPSQKGVTFKLELVESLVNALTEAEEVLEKRTDRAMVVPG